MEFLRGLQLEEYFTISSGSSSCCTIQFFLKIKIGTVDTQFDELKKVIFKWFYQWKTDDEQIKGLCVIWLDQRIFLLSPMVLYFISKWFSTFNMCACGFDVSVTSLSFNLFFTCWNYSIVSFQSYPIFRLFIFPFFWRGGDYLSRDCVAWEAAHFWASWPATTSGGSRAYWTSQIDPLLFIFSCLQNGVFLFIRLWVYMFFF